MLDLDNPRRLIDERKAFLVAKEEAPGFLHDVLITEAAQEEFVAWTDDDARSRRKRDAGERLRRLMWMAQFHFQQMELKGKGDGLSTAFQVGRVPRDGASRRETGTAAAARLVSAVDAETTRPYFIIMLDSEFERGAGRTRAADAAGGRPEEAT